jgi:hypothetical protein
VVLTGTAPPPILFLAGAICVGYGQAPKEAPAAVQVSHAGRTEQITVLPVLPAEAKRFLIN